MAKETSYFIQEFPVLPEMVDYNGHVNNVVFVQWMQDVAIEHASNVGFDTAMYEEHGVSWVARVHHIEYRQSAFEGDNVIVVTWIADARKVACRRKYEFRRNTMDGDLLAQAETEWVFIDKETGRPRKLLSQFMNRFELLGDENPIGSQ